jgi:hypothetical protein
LQHLKPKIISTSTKYLINKHNTNSYKSKLKIYQFNNKTHKIKRQCNYLTLIFWCLGGGSTSGGSGEAVNRSLDLQFATKKIVERLMKTWGRWFWCFDRGLKVVFMSDWRLVLLWGFWFLRFFTLQKQRP